MNCRGLLPIKEAFVLDRYVRGRDEAHFIWIKKKKSVYYVTDRSVIMYGHTGVDLLN